MTSEHIGTHVPAADAAPIERSTLGVGEKLAYGAGEIGSAVGWNLVVGFLAFYYTDVALLPVAAVGTLILVARILDALFDPLAGVLVDRTATRFGRARPYLLAAPLLFAILLVLTFSVPQSTDTVKVAYAYATFILLGLAYSFVSVPYTALLPMMTRAGSDKMQLASLRSIGTSCGSILIYGLALPVVHAMGAGSDRTGFTIAAAMAGLGAVLAFAVVFVFCRERHVVYVPKQHAQRDARFVWTQNPVWIAVALFAFLMFVRVGVVVADTAYFAKSVLGEVGRATSILPLLSVAILVGGLVATPLCRSLGMRQGNLLMLLSSAVLSALLPLTLENFALFLTCFMLASISIGVNTVTIFALIADATELQERREGQRREGLIASTTSFCAKVGMALGAAMVAMALGAADYSPESPESARATITALFYFVPAILALAQAAVFAIHGTGQSSSEVPAFPSGLQRRRR